ncbi:cyclin-Y-like [Centruroides sculpturatus]|uniref:cyclin-Y-like n=1 Tax=Centruroides sculpturatus TaxID=218467 RepID=UPI000C6EF6B1|nr:cyclin-Y-like [Centruroides sculpturatus]
MGNKLSCCTCGSPRVDRRAEDSYLPEAEVHQDESISNLQHISEREPEDIETDPSTHPTAGPLFMQRSKSDVRSKLF